MNHTIRWGPLAIWHHRILGGLWALASLAMSVNFVYDMIHQGSPELWYALSITVICCVAGIGFTRGRKWERCTMGVLMVFALLLFLDMALMFGFHNNLPAFYEALACAGVAVYTLGFLIISAIWHSQESPR